MTATELRSAKRYWQVTQSKESKRIYPSVYEQNVVGILWTTKIFYGTWFGQDPFLIYGIQLLPLTPISEERDDLDWAMEMFHPFAKSCNANCVSEGWSVQVLAILATIGHKDLAAEHTQNLSSWVFDTPGGNGHSKSNTLWYISTRPEIDEAYTLTESYPWEDVETDLTCSQPVTCTEDVLNSMAGEYACYSRIKYLINAQGLSEWDACKQIAVDEFPEECGQCSPSGTEADDTSEIEADNVDGIGADDIEADDADGIEQDGTGDMDSGLTCNQPTTCTDVVLDSMAGDFPCRERMQWLMDTKGLLEKDACMQVAADEFPTECGPCNPAGVNGG
jgi:hypothetical protein